MTGYDVYEGASNLGIITGTSANITGLTANTSHTFSVRAKDAAGNVSNASSSINVTTLGNAPTYCTSSGNRTTYEWIDYVALGGMTNLTGASSGYADYTNSTVTVARGSSNTLTVSAGFSGTAYTEFWNVWIDFNHDGTFDASENVASGSSSSAANLTATFSVPSNAVLGNTRMRVSMKYNAAATACENFGDGEVEDYTVNITASGSSYTTHNDDISENLLGNEDATINKYDAYIDHYHTGGVSSRNEINTNQELNYPAIVKAILANGFEGYIAQEFIPKNPDKLAALKEAIAICSV